MDEGTWPKDDLRRAFVDGAKWWEYHSTKFTMWQSDQRVVEEEAERRYVNHTGRYCADCGELIAPDDGFSCPKCGGCL